MAIQKFSINGEHYEIDDEQEEHSQESELKVINNLDYTPRIPRKLVKIYKQHPKQTKILHFIIPTPTKQSCRKSSEPGKMIFTVGLNYPKTIFFVGSECQGIDESRS